MTKTETEGASIRIGDAEMRVTASKTGFKGVGIVTLLIGGLRVGEPEFDRYLRMAELTSVILPRVSWSV